MSERQPHTPTPSRGRSGETGPAPAPVLVTGTHRSGTTWLGQMLALSNELAPVHEPFNPTYPWTWLHRPAPHWFTYVSDHNEHQYNADIERLKDLRYPLRSTGRRVRSLRNAAAVARDATEAFRWRQQQRSLLMKDPIAFFSAPWLAERHGLRPVVLVRHPAAFTSSLVRLGWGFDFKNWADQPALMTGPLSPFAAEIERRAAQPGDLVDHAILIWRAINHVVQHSYRARDGSVVLRYEDLASDPTSAFPPLYASLGLRWSRDVDDAMGALTTSASSQEMGVGDHMSVRRNSQAAMWTWLDRLDTDTVTRVRDGTSDVAEHFYDDRDWTKAD